MKNNALNISVLITLLLAYSILLSSPDLISPTAFTDSGAVSFMTLALISLGLGMCLYLALDTRRTGRLHWLLLAYVFMIYLMREADFHTAFSGQSLTKLATYGLTEIPLGIRLTGAIMLILMAAILIYLLARYTRTLVQGMITGQAWSIAFLLWFVLLLSSQVFDRKISTSGTHWKLTVIEELLEISAAVFAVLAITQTAFTATRDVKNQG